MRLFTLISIYRKETITQCMLLIIILNILLSNIILKPLHKFSLDYIGRYFFLHINAPFLVT